MYGRKEARRDGRGQNLNFLGAFSVCAYMGFVCMWETWTKSGVLRTCTMYKCIYIHTPGCSERNRIRCTQLHEIKLSQDCLLTI